MSAYFFDTSALVKCYVTEVGSAWVRQLSTKLDRETKGRSNQIFVSQIAIVEAAAFAILVRQRLISKQDGKDVYDRFIHDVEREYRVVDLTPATVQRAAQLTQQHPLKAYDAIQLAAGLNAESVLMRNEFTLVFVTSDNALLRAARAEGLMTENPHDHADQDGTPR